MQQFRSASGKKTTLFLSQKKIIHRKIAPVKVATARLPYTTILISHKLHQRGEKLLQTHSKL